MLTCQNIRIDTSPLTGSERYLSTSASRLCHGSEPEALACLSRCKIFLAQISGFPEFEAVCSAGVGRSGVFLYF